MRKLIVFLTPVFLLFLLAFAASAADGGNVGDCACALDVSVAHGTNKITAIESAAALVKSGTAPDNTNYFSAKARRRNISDGYYTITEAETNLCFNVNTDGADNDYDGIGLTVWENTEDITQRFRLVMNDDGSYTLYAACSRGGFSRAVGYDSDKMTLGLYGTDSDKTTTFFIKNATTPGKKLIVLSRDESMCLAIPEDAENSTPAELCRIGEKGYLSEWIITNWGADAGDGGEMALYPASILTVTQGPYDIYSHQEQNAIDMQVNDGESIVAPFTCRVVAINEECGNAVWIESTSEVLYADGSYDYMTCMFMHDNDISDIYIGEFIPQGVPFYEMGTAGYALGEHCHISCCRGKYKPTMKVDNTGPEAVNPWEAFFLPQDITVRYDYDFPWVYAPST